MATQTFVVRLEETLARRVLRTVDGPGHGYASLDEFVAVALVNQLGAEEVAAQRPQSHGLLARPGLDRPPTPMASPVASSEPLLLVTNRLSPVKVATRVLFNLQRLVGRLPDDRVWPTAKTFRTTAGHAARALGLELQRQDRAEGRSGRAKRWVGYPVGSDERASLERFAASFALTASDRVVSGPLVVLGLAAPVADGRVALTEAGVRLAAASSPLLDESGAGTLSHEERAILIDQVATAPAERTAVAEFLQLVRDSDGRQSRVDEQLASRHHSWTTQRAVAQRAAMIGRLVELQILQIEGRGAAARLEATPAAERFLHTFDDEADGTPLDRTD